MHVKKNSKEITKRRQAADAEVDKFAASRLRYLRKEKGITQEGFADLLCMSFQQYWKYETAQTALKIGRLRAIAKVLEVSPLEFFEKNATEQDRLAIATKHIKASVKHSTQALDALGIKQPKKGTK